MDNKEELEEIIEKKREEMIQVGITKGLTHSSTIRCSQELDQLLNIRRSLYTTNKNIQAFYKLVV
ncbi:aspartyl-phosphate phosphatase Spo0E family protein [Bacillus sp. FJAT-45350]|uniref:aspartyl-phosphate phosphatase Spo0E family protein n=1 Tax=Bacillus sp. FJAT-45350 TaxID=2011014 RepID=UPI000BB6BEB6|nr:aspartyl-phosphate phosphatase Spo0E family protein [Bacillus sp. FJAT-45350]